MDLLKSPSITPRGSANVAREGGLPLQRRRIAHDEATSQKIRTTESVVTWAILAQTHLLPYF